MAGTTGGALITDTELEDWLAERGATVEDIQAPGRAQTAFIDYLGEVRERAVVPAEPFGLPGGPPPEQLHPESVPHDPRPVSIPLPSLGGLTGGVVSSVTDALAGPFGAIADIVGRITGVIRDLAEATIPTISELALGIASAVGDGLNFITENMAEVDDFAGGMAAALITPLEALAEVVGDALRVGMVRIIGFISNILRLLVALLPPLTMERPI